MASTVAANAQIRSILQARSAASWQYAAQAAWGSAQSMMHRCPEWVTDALQIVVVAMSRPLDFSSGRLASRRGAARSDW